MARRATKVKQERAANPHVLLLDAGDSWLGDQPLAQKTKGAASVEVMNQLGYDAMTLGQRELQLDLDTLRERMTAAQFAVLSANVVISGSGELVAEPYIIKRFGDRRVAIMGLTEEGAGPAPASATGQPAVVVTDPIEAAGKYVAEASQKADVIILLSHLGRVIDLQLVAEVPGIDLIVEGRLDGSQPGAIRDEATGTLLALAEVPKPGHAGRMVGVVRLQISNQGPVADYEWEIVPLKPDYADDPDMLEWLANY